MANTTLWCTAALLSITPSVLAGTAEAQDAEQSDRPYCTWSEVWTELGAKFPKMPEGATITDSKRTKGSITRPRSTVSHIIRGAWLVEAVIDDRGKVRDAKIVASPQIEPPWPEYEKEIIDSILKWKYKPVRVDGTPWPNCTTITIREQ